MTTNRRYATVSVRLLTLAAIAAASLGTGCASLSLSGTHHQADDSASGYASIMRAAESVRRSGDLATATMLYQRAHHLESHDAPPLIALGEIAASAGAPGQAATAFREALRRSPDDVNARRLYGNALLAVDAPAQAAEQFRHVLEVEPEDARALNALGVSLDLQGKHEEAQRIYWNALERRPDHLPLRNNLALSIALTGDFEQAFAIFQDLTTLPRASTSPLDPLHYEQVQENILMVASLAAGDDVAGVTTQHLDVSQPERNPPSPPPLIVSPDRLLEMAGPVPLQADATGLSPAAESTSPPAASVQPADKLGWPSIENLILTAAGPAAYRWFDPTTPPPVDRREM